MYNRMLLKKRNAIGNSMLRAVLRDGTVGHCESALVNVCSPDDWLVAIVSRMVRMLVDPTDGRPTERPSDGGDVPLTNRLRTGQRRRCVEAVQ